MAIGKTNATGAVMEYIIFYSGGLDQPAVIHLNRTIPRKLFFYNSYPTTLTLSGKQICWIYVDFESNTCCYMETNSATGKVASGKDKKISVCPVCTINLDIENRQVILTPKEGYKWIGDEATTILGYTVVMWG